METKLRLSPDDAERLLKEAADALFKDVRATGSIGKLIGSLTSNTLEFYERFAGVTAQLRSAGYIVEIAGKKGVMRFDNALRQFGGYDVGDCIGPDMRVLLYYENGKRIRVFWANGNVMD